MPHKKSSPQLPFLVKIKSFKNSISSFVTIFFFRLQDEWKNSRVPHLPKPQLFLEQIYLVVKVTVHLRPISQPAKANKEVAFSKGVSSSTPAYPAAPADSYMLSLRETNGKVGSN